MGESLKKYVLLTEQRRHQQLFEKLVSDIKAEWTLVNKKQDFTFEQLSKLQPAIIFIPHWSHIIPASIFETFECIVFHMTDLPYGRGGSPLQNLIIRGHTNTKISALKVEKDIDAGNIYLKRDLTLEGTGAEIFERADKIIAEMIANIVMHQPVAVPQQGVPVFFKRRNPEDGNIMGLDDLSKVYDYIRMLDCPGYPNAFLETEHLRFEFAQASFTDNKETLNAYVRIIKK